MDLKHFELVVEDWVERDLLILHQINTSNIYADGLSKALSRTLFYRQMNSVMGRIVPVYAYKMMNLVVRHFFDQNVSDFDKNLRFLSWEHTNHIITYSKNIIQNKSKLK